MKKKIIGYEAPFDMTGSTDFIHKGDIFTRKEGDFFYTNDGIVKRKNPLPKEIVEKWKPVYEEKYKIGDWITILKIEGGGWLNDSKTKTFQITRMPTSYFNGTYYTVENKVTLERGGLHATFRKATDEEISPYLIENVKFKNFSVEDNGDYLKIGCERVEKSFVRELIRLIQKHDLSIQYKEQILKLQPFILEL